MSKTHTHLSFANGKSTLPIAYYYHSGDYRSLSWGDHDVTRRDEETRRRDGRISGPPASEYSFGWGDPYDWGYAEDFDKEALVAMLRTMLAFVENDGVLTKEQILSLAPCLKEPA